MEFTSKEKARQIMGDCFFDPKETAHAFGLKLTARQINFFEQVPFTERMLRYYSEQCLLMPVPKIAICDMRVSGKNKDNKWKLGWLRREEFTKKSGENRWRLICNAEKENLSEDNWRLQQIAIQLDYFHYQPELTIPKDNWNSLLPTVREMIFAILASYLLKDKIIFREIAATTSSLSTNVNSCARFTVGPFNPQDPRVQHLLGLEVHLCNTDSS